MAYADFTLSGLTKQFNLTTDEETLLFTEISPAVLRPEFLSELREDTSLALSISTEKARSEFIIAPVLGEMRRMTGRKIGLFSGVDFTVDQAHGLAGICDYIITLFPEQLFIKAPVLMLVEAKNEDMKRGYAQCIAEMLAAQAFNARESEGIETIYGVVTTGNLWRFLRLQETHVNIEGREYHIDDVDRIMGVLLHLAGYSGSLRTP